MANRFRYAQRLLLATVLCQAVFSGHSVAALAKDTCRVCDKAAVAPASSEFSIDSAILPGRLRAIDLDSVRGVNARAALDRALRDAEVQRMRREKGEFAPELRYRAPSNPYEAHSRIQEEYGPDAIITRSASTVAALAGGIEKGSAKSIDGVTTVTESLVNLGGNALGFDPIEMPRLKPHISAQRAGVYVSADW